MVLFIYCNIVAVVYTFYMSEKDLTTFKRILSENNYRVTKARQSTFAILLSPEPQSIRQILIKTKGKVDRVSVYRSIEVFEKLGIVHRVNMGWKYKLELGDQFMSHHHHLTCLNCGKVIDIGDEKHIDEFIRQVTKEFDFTVRRHQFEIDGICQACSKKSKSF